MSIIFDGKIDIDRFMRDLSTLEKKQVPFALSRAMEDTVKAAGDKAAETAKRDLDRPTKPLQEAGPRKYIRYRWPTKGQIASGFKSGDRGKTAGAVFIIAPLVEELHPVVFGGRIDSVPQDSHDGSVLVPTRAVIRGLAGSGRLRRLNRFGNITSLRRGALSKAREAKENFLDVPYRNNNPRLSHLQPGLYARVRSTTGRAGSRSRRTGRMRSSRKGALILLIAYVDSRVQKVKWKFDEIVVREYQQVFNERFAIRFRQALRTAR